MQAIIQHLEPLPQSKCYALSLRVEPKSKDIAIEQVSARQKKRYRLTHMGPESGWAHNTTHLHKLLREHTLTHTPSVCLCVCVVEQPR